ncbi:MAG: hypothetical protein HC892_23140 [Saprospiraceae bacterium]|nr:hypothetical protein [Saprospiraceae bacterium]
MDFYALNPNTLINIAEILTSQKDDKNYEVLANRILSVALSGKIEESQVVKAVVNLKKVSEPDDVIRFISETFLKYPSLANNATLFEKRATAKMDLAKNVLIQAEIFKVPLKQKQGLGKCADSY